MSDLILHEDCGCAEENLQQLRLIQEQSKTILKLQDLIASADMRSRLAFGEAREANEKMQKLVEKNKKDFEFLMNSPKQMEKFKNKNKGYGGINV
tara:strand:+ start:613 stop:897 length:285 start_codon:yes stop_codon:yes gene_type:complete